MRIAHLSLDEKFIDIAIDQFNLLSNVDSTFCAQANGNEFKFIKSKNVKLFHSSEDMVSFINEGKFDYVVMHSMCISPRYLLKLEAPILWCSWGFDIYSDKSSIIKRIIHLSLYKPLTRAAANVGPQSAKDKITLLLRKIGIRSKRQKRLDQLIKKIPYLSVVLPSEFEAVQKAYPHFKLFPFTYINRQKSVPFSPYSGTNNSILLGNSLDPANNHIDILDTLEKRSIRCNAYIPISYPVNDAYKKSLKDFASKLKYVQVHFLEDYMPLSDYYKIIDGCSVAIFGHIRQQAIGNIFRMFYTGKKILLYKNSIAYNYFQKKNLHLFTIEDDLQASIFEAPLSIEKQKINYDFANDDDNFEKHMATLQTFFDQLQKSIG